MNKKTKIVLIVVIVLAVAALIFTLSTNAPEKGLKIQDFKTALEKNGLTVTNENSKWAGMIGAKEGYSYEINGSNIEIYEFDLNSKDSLTVENLKKVKEEGKITMPSFSNYTFDGIYNKGLVLCNYEDHPDKDKIIEIFKGL